MNLRLMLRVADIAIGWTGYGAIDDGQSSR
jgi:hypothetical protein